MAINPHLKEMLQTRVMAPLLDKMDSWEASLVQRPGALHGAADSPVRFNIPREAIKMKGDQPPLPGFPRSLPQMVGSMTHIRRSFLSLERNPPHAKKHIDDATLAELQAYAHAIGADEIGFAAVPAQWVFRNAAIAYDRAIVLVMEMDRERMSTAPSPDTAVMVHETYNALGQVTTRIADWLRERGYAAHAGHPLGGLALYPPMAQAAGLGWRGMSGLLITPRFGPRVRLAAVFSEIENLPRCEGNEHQWVLDFCAICRRCLRDCPAGAFYESPLVHENRLVTVLDSYKCFPYFVANHGCSVCIKVCPFNTLGYDEVKRRFFGRKKSAEII